MISALPPGLILIVGAIFVPFIKGRAKSVYMMSLPVISFLILLQLAKGVHGAVTLFGFDLVFTRVDELSLPFGYIFVLISFIGLLFASKVDDDVQHVSALMYAGGALGVVFAGDLVSLYLFWELLAVASTFLILARKTKASQEAAYRYVLVHIFGGLCLLGGIVLQIHQTGHGTLGYIGLGDTAGWLIFVGVALNAAVPPLHPWLKDAYPEATVTGAVFLCALTTKSAVYLMARTFPGAELLIWLGAVMTLFPLIYGILEDDVRRVLAYVLINQVGFMICGIGLGTTMSINGAVAHAFCDILYIGLLFMVAGAVLHMTGKIRFSELGGLYKTMPVTSVFCVIGAASISGLPLLNDFVSKTMVLGAVSHEKMPLVWLILVTASAGVALVAGFKVPFYIFFRGRSHIRASDPPLHMLVAMGMAALLCLGIGLYPSSLYQLLPYTVDFSPYTVSHVVHEVEIILGAAVAFTGLIRFHRLPFRTGVVYLDVDWFYRRGGSAFYGFVDKTLNGINRLSELFFARRIPEALATFSKKPIRFLANACTGLTGRRPFPPGDFPGTGGPETMTLLPMGVAVLVGLATLFFLIVIFVIRI